MFNNIVLLAFVAISTSVAMPLSILFTLIATPEDRRSMKPVLFALCVGVFAGLSQSYIEYYGL